METNKVMLKQNLAIKEVIIYLEDLVKSLKDGKVVVQQEESYVDLNLPETASVVVEAKNKKGKAKFSLELSWHMAPVVETGKVCIGSKVPEAKAEEMTKDKKGCSDDKADAPKDTKAKGEDKADKK